MARPGGLTPGPGPATSQHANIVTVGRERERERDGEGAASECLQTSTGRDTGHPVSLLCDLTDQKLLKAG